MCDDTSGTRSSHVGKIYGICALPAEGRCIRLLELEAAPDKADPLMGKLRLTLLQDDGTTGYPEFTAFSYTRGKPISLRENIIWYNNEVIEITHNCKEALQQIRALHGQITIWVDAICINQQDKKEKATQIPLMQEIFSRAKTVVIWLGRASLPQAKPLTPFR
jgi:glycyl-tRNA synthetase beta subunit